MIGIKCIVFMNTIKVIGPLYLEWVPITTIPIRTADSGFKQLMVSLELEIPLHNHNINKITQVITWMLLMAVIVGIVTVIMFGSK